MHYMMHLLKIHVALVTSKLPMQPVGLPLPPLLTSCMQSVEPTTLICSQHVVNAYVDVVGLDYKS